MMKLFIFCLMSFQMVLSPIIVLAKPGEIENRTSQVNLFRQLDEDAEAIESEKEIETETETETEAVDEPSPEEIARLKKLATADLLYLSGYKVDAVKLYREAKEPWDVEQERINKNGENSPELFDDVEQLSFAGKVFWRNYQQGKKRELESKVLSALKLLSTREPEFILGHIHYAQALRQYERKVEADKVLDRAVSLYPKSPELLKARLEAYALEEEWLDASILARQFALFNAELPSAAEFTQLAEEYLQKYQKDLRSKIALNAVGNAIVGTVGFALTGSLLGPLSALETASILLQGESAVGSNSVKQARKQLPLVTDPRITEYVDRIGQKVATESGRDDFDYEFHIIMDDSLNAFALPGGKIFVNAGAIMKTDSEAELAGLLAHEVAHSALSHGFQLITKGNFTANIVRYIPYVGNAATSLIVMNYSRDMERQADIFGTRILVNSGYAADGVRNLMQKLHQSHQEEDNPEPVEWFSTHPNSHQRIRYLEQLIVDRNLDRFVYEGIYPHQSVKHLVREQWQAYAECIEDVVTIEEAKECAEGKQVSGKN